jgi:hypothetical protein
VPANRPGLAAVAYPGPARPSYGDIASFGEFSCDDTRGPVPTGPSGRCGGRRAASATPGVFEEPEPKISVWIWWAAPPRPELGGEFAHKGGWSAKVKVGIARHPQLPEQRHAQASGSVNIDSRPVRGIGCAIANVDRRFAWRAVRHRRARGARAQLQPDYGKLIVYELPKENLVYGPFQIEALINQNTEISQQLSGQNQMASRVSAEIW